MRTCVIFVIVSALVLRKMGNVSDEICRENQNTNLMLNKSLFFENCTVYEIICKNMIETDGPLMTIKYGACSLHAG
jgi:hypothetical protein